MCTRCVWLECFFLFVLAFDGVWNVIGTTSVSAALVQHVAFYPFDGMNTEGDQSRMTDASGLEGSYSSGTLDDVSMEVRFQDVYDISEESEGLFGACLRTGKETATPH